MKALKNLSVFLISSLFCIASVRAEDTEYFLKISGNRPYGIACDNNGLMYMITAPHAGNGTLSTVTPDGTITDIAVLEGKFIGPGICIATDKSIYIAVGNKIIRVLPDSTADIIAEGFSLCFDLKRDHRDNMYVADDYTGTIYKITRSGEQQLFYKSDTSGLFLLTSLVIDRSNEHLYAREGNRILKFKLNSNNAPGQPEILVDNLKLFYMCRDKNNNIYASTLENVIQIDAHGKTQYLSQDSLKTPIGVAVGGKGFDTESLYVTVEDGIVKVPVPK